jgi:hypothetical protein
MNVMQDVLNLTKHLKYVVLLSYLKEKSTKKLHLGVYLKINKAQANKRNNNQIFVNVKNAVLEESITEELFGENIER